MGKYDSDEYIGIRFGNVTTIRHAEHGGLVVRCDCGNEKTVAPYLLLTGHVRSCGKCNYRRTAFDNGTSVNGHSNTRAYHSWYAIMKRCYDPQKEDYEKYGGKGITVCDEWHDFTKFYDWSLQNGYKEDAAYRGFTLKRIDKTKEYSPENCVYKQSFDINHKRNVRGKRLNWNTYTYYMDGEKHTLNEWLAIYGMYRDTVSSRMSKGMTFEEAIKDKRWVRKNHKTE